MSKRSRRRARGRRSRQVATAAAGGVHPFAPLAAAVARAGEHMTAAMVGVAGAVARYAPDLLACFRAVVLFEVADRHDDWGRVVRAAWEKRDALPLLVYADWCAENGHPVAESLARSVAAGLLAPAAQPTS